MRGSEPADNERAGKFSPQSLEFFETRVRPLLVERCQSCHGEKKQEGGLRLDSRTAILKGGDGGAVIVPGSPEKSRLIEAIGYGDESLQMPPDKRLPDAAIAALTQWIRLGAPWPVGHETKPDARSPAEAWRTHWAAQPVRPQTASAVRQTEWPLSPIDRFILAKLEENELHPSPPADRRTLLRRATFDLWGLPPTQEEIAAFEQDASPEAFAKVIERLLASPKYGERWGRHWLDAARYADTKEYVRLNEERRLLYAFAYRDYVVRAFNEDLPYDRFVTEQLAADLLPGGNRRALAALGFLSLGRQFTGNPHDIIDDRIDVVTRGLLGLTADCARCHDHKYDPIPTADYYALYGVFDRCEAPAVPALIETAPIDAAKHAHLQEAERLEAALDRFQRRAHRALVDELRSNVGAYLSAALEGRRPYLVPLPANPGEVRHFVAERWLDLIDAAASGAPAFVPWHALAAIKPGEDFRAHSVQILSELSAPPVAGAPRTNALVLAALQRRTLDSMADVARAYGDALDEAYRDWQTQFDAENLLANGGFEAEGETANAAPAGWRLSGVRFCVSSGEGVTAGRLAAVFGDGTPESRPPTAHEAVISQTVKTRPGARYRLTFDTAAYGSDAEAHAQTLRVTVDGSRRLIEHAISAPGARPVQFEAFAFEFLADGPEITITFADATTNGEAGMTDRVLDNVRLVETSQSSAENTAAIVAAGDADRAELLAILLGDDSPTAVSPNDAVDFYLYEAPDHERVMALRKRLNDWLAQSDHAPLRAHVLADRSRPYEQRVLVRGDPTRRGALAQRKFLSALPGENRQPFGAGSGRLELARAIASLDNPLTARVLVNRVWQRHFGAGLVASTSNFGLRGDPPSHRELLDDLAWRFMAEGWSIKQLHRSIMLSSVYQQSSAFRADGFARDPENRLLWRMNRRRLDVESFRDAMLLTAGALDSRVGGPPGDLGDPGFRRRTLYGLVDRQQLYGMLGDFDFASPESHSPLRHLTTAPQQALFLLNSPFMLQQAASFAERPELAALADAGERIAAMYRLAFGRSPEGEELQAARAFLDGGGSWPELAQAILASNEFCFVD